MTDHGYDGDTWLTTECFDALKVPSNHADDITDLRARTVDRYDGPWSDRRHAVTLRNNEFLNKCET